MSILVRTLLGMVIALGLNMAVASEHGIPTMSGDDPN